MSALLELYWANLTEFLSNRRAIFLTVAFPVLFIVIFGLVFSNQDKQDPKVGIVNEDTSGTWGEEIANDLQLLPKGTEEDLEGSEAPNSVKSLSANANTTEGNPYSETTFVTGKKDDLMRQLKEGKIDAVVVIPEDTSTQVDSQEPTEIELHIDPSKQTLIPFLAGGIGAVLEEIDKNLTGRTPLLSLKTIPTHSKDLRIIDYLLPGILAMSIMQLGLFATAQPLISLRVTGVLKRLGATPLKRSTLLIAYVALRLTVALIQTALIVAIGTLAFQVKIVGNWFELAGWLILGTLMFLSLGFFMAAVAKNEETAIAAANVINLPMLLLAGIFFPISHLPHFMTWVVNIVPLNYLADAMRQVMVDAPPLHTLTADAIALIIWTLVMTLLAVRYFKWEEAK